MPRNCTILDIVKEMPQGFRKSHGELYCSFCRKSQKEVAKLFSSPHDDPRVYICDECVAVCHQIREEKEDPLEGNPLLSTFLDATEEWIAAEARGRDASEKLSNVRRIASLIFADSLELKN